MILTEQQINYIDKNLQLYGLKNQTLNQAKPLELLCAIRTVVQACAGMKY